MANRLAQDGKGSVSVTRSAAVVLIAMLVSGCALSPPHALPYPTSWPAFATGAPDGCAALTGRYRNMPAQWEDAGHQLATVTEESDSSSSR